MKKLIAVVLTLLIVLIFTTMAHAEIKVSHTEKIGVAYSEIVRVDADKKLGMTEYSGFHEQTNTAGIKTTKGRIAVDHAYVYKPFVDIGFYTAYEYNDTSNYEGVSGGIGPIWYVLGRSDGIKDFLDTSLYLVYDQINGDSTQKISFRIKSKIKLKYVNWRGKVTAQRNLADSNDDKINADAMLTIGDKVEFGYRVVYDYWSLGDHKEDILKMAVFVWEF